jgi:uncharacterized protein YbjT (DUF2867 family)
MTRPLILSEGLMNRSDESQGSFHLHAPDELTQAMLTFNAARDASVKGIVYLSVFKGEAYADVPHFASKMTVQRMIDAYDLSVTILRPAYFIQNDMRQKDALLDGGVYGMPVGAKGISMVDVRDIGEAAAKELLRREQARARLPREIYELVGPDAPTGEKLAALWSDVLDRPIRYGGDDLETLERRLKAFGPPWLAYDMKLMMRRYREDGRRDRGGRCTPRGAAWSSAAFLSRLCNCSGRRMGEGLRCQVPRPRAINRKYQA